MKERGIRVNAELMYVTDRRWDTRPIPYPVGAKGPVFHINLELNF